MRKIHVEKREVWELFILEEDGTPVEPASRWQHDTEREAVECADRMFRKKLVQERGEDKL